MRKTVFIITILLMIDICSKYCTYWYVPKMLWIHSVYPYGGYGVFEDLLGGVSLSINHVQNKGAAWGLFANYSEQLFWLRSAIVLSLFSYTLFFVRSKSQQFLFLLIIAGAIGNIIDHFLYGFVIDMIHFNFWGYTFPLFNFADICITIGILFLTFASLFRKNSYTVSD